MNRIAGLALLLCCLTFGAVAQEDRHTTPAEIDREHTKWIASALQSTQTIKVGMTRSDLLKVFTTEGGLSSPSWRTYVYRQCPYIKVDVKFDAPSREELPKDKIVEISRPYLGWSIYD
jgi:hypothetical protein